MNLLMLTIAFRPNIGGIETHFDDFIQVATKKNINVTVLTYKPITSRVKAQAIEKGKNYTIYRLPWIPGLFYKLTDKPALAFLYLVPGLFFITPVILLIQQKITVIHAHGLIAGFVGIIWGKIFKKKVVISTHSVYNIPKQGAYSRFARWVFSSADTVLCLSQQSVKEIAALGVNSKKLKKFTYWVDLEKFKPLFKKKIKKELGWEKKFIVFFVGRLISVKGVQELLQSTKYLSNDITIVIAGDGPLYTEVREAEKRSNGKILFLGKIVNKDLPKYYNGADIAIVPSTQEEGFGRVIIEALACGTPVIGANRGGIPEAMDETVGMLITVTPENIAKAVTALQKNSAQLEKLTENTREYVLKHYSEENINTILQTYK
jgi:glycosyltransferase involved in cell wall biosynthesis